MTKRELKSEGHRETQKGKKKKTCMKRKEKLVRIQKTRKEKKE